MTHETCPSCGKSFPKDELFDPASFDENEISFDFGKERYCEECAKEVLFEAYENRKEQWAVESWLMRGGW